MGNSKAGWRLVRVEAPSCWELVYEFQGYDCLLLNKSKKTDFTLSLCTTMAPGFFSSILVHCQLLPGPFLWFDFHSHINCPALSLLHSILFYIICLHQLARNTFNFKSLFYFFSLFRNISLEIISSI